MVQLESWLNPIGRKELISRGTDFVHLAVIETLVPRGIIIRRLGRLDLGEGMEFGSWRLYCLAGSIEVVVLVEDGFVHLDIEEGLFDQIKCDNVCEAM